MATLRTTYLGRAFCLGGAALGAIGLIGWVMGVQALVTIVPGQPPMMPNTALALLLLGMAGALPDAKHSGRVSRLLSWLAASVVLVIGIGTLAEYALDLPFSIDQLLVHTEGGPFPGRPSPPTAVALACLAAAILLRDSPSAMRVQPLEWLLLCAGMIAVTALLGQAFGAGTLYQLTRTPIIGVAVHTALSLIMISLGLLLEHPDLGIMRMAMSPSPGGMLLRRLTPIAILVPVLFGLTAARLLALPGVVDVSLIFAALIVISSLVSLLLLTATAQQLDRAHEALEQSRRETRDLIDLASEGIFIADLEGRYIGVNDAGCRMLGYSREEILGKTIIDFIPPEDEARLRSDRERFLQGGSSVGEWKLLTKNRAYLPVEVGAKILPDGRWLAFVRDISDRKRAEEALRRSESRYRTLVTATSVVTWSCPPSGLQVEPQPDWMAFTGQTAEEMLGDGWVRSVHPEDRAAARLKWEEAVVRGEPFSSEHRIRRHDGQWRWMSVQAVPIRSAAGEIVEWFAMSIDITERKDAEVALRQAQERFELALQGAGLAAWDWNIKTGEVIVNSRWAEMRGFRLEEIRPHVDSWIAGVHPDDLAGVQKVLSDHLEGVRPDFECEYRAATKSGDWIWILSKGKIFARDEQGRPTRMVGTALDISERKHAEEQIRLAQERFELALRGANLATWDWNIKTGEVVFNPRWAEMRGFRPEEISPTVDSWSKGIHPDDWPTVQSRVRDCFEGKHPEFECEYRVAPKSGEWIWILDHGKVFERDEHGKPTRMVGTELDMTARKRAEEALRESEERFRLFMDNSPTLAWLKDEEGRYVYLSRTYEQRIGVRLADWRGKTDAELWPPSVASEFRKNDLAVLEADEPIEIIEESSNPDGSRCFWLSTKFPFRDLAARRYVAGIGLDITARKQAEEAIRLSEAKFSGIVSISADAIISIDKNQKITLFNQGAEKIFGWSSAEAIGRPLDILVPERFRAIHARHVEAFAVGEGAARRMGARGSMIFGVRKNGEEFPADAAISGIVVGGKRILTVALRDITELKEAEAAAKRAAQARDDILGIVAHDLRNPLAAIVSLAHVLRAKGPETEVGKEIAVAANRMNRLIGDLLDVTRMEAGHLSLKQERVPALEIITDALEGQTPLASSASLELRLEAAPELPDVWADRDRLLQVFENLIGNAIKFTKPGGRIMLAATVQASEVLFTVSDTGRGIAETHLPHVFDRFWQAPGTERRGMGFGLAIVKGIVEAHGGRVWVQSSPDQGSIFFFTVPIAAAQSAAAHAA